jgi:hypothetical protein
MDRGKRQSDRFNEMEWFSNPVISQPIAAPHLINEFAAANTNELAANYNHQQNSIHQYIYYYQQTATKIPSTNESTAANHYPQSVGRNENAGGQCHRAAMTASHAAAQNDAETVEAGLA